ncbi:MAG: hypothetical protein N3D12_00510 [Candidatus Methanomethyliaceae archaeon]|nr:hypothetical protein [Candidatus Methanomethyliaceae archaeon]
MYYSFDVGRFLVQPCRTLIGFFGSMKLGVAALPTLASFLRDHNITVCQIISSSIEGCQDELMVLAFLDLTHSDVQLERLLEEINGSGL